MSGTVSGGLIGFKNFRNFVTTMKGKRLSIEIILFLARRAVRGFFEFMTKG